MFHLTTSFQNLRVIIICDLFPGKELFVRGLPLETEEKKLKKFFVKLGVEVEGIRLIDKKK